MFEDSLLESGNRYRGGGRNITALISYVMLLVFLGVLILVPMVFPETMSLKQEWVTALMAPPPPPPAPPPPAAPAPVVVKKIQSELVQGQLRTPTKIPQKVQMIKEEEPPPPSTGGGGGVVGGVPGGSAGGSLGGVLGGIINNQPTIKEQPKVATPQRVRVSSGVSEGLLINKVAPTYPQLAKQARIQGTVILEAIIGKDGSIQNLHLIQGHPMLAPAAMDAVKRWHYKPYFLNGEPVEVDTVITVNFSLSGG
jgi:protein TonB